MLGLVEREDQVQVQIVVGVATKTLVDEAASCEIDGIECVQYIGAQFTDLDGKTESKFSCVTEVGIR